MKQLLKYLSIVLIAGIIFIACDKIEEPYVEENANIWNGRKVLMLDFTGHHCPNCPEGHRTLEDLQNSFGEAIVPVAIHATYFARHGNDSTEPFYYDFTCPTGIELGGDTQGGAGYFNIFGLPVAAINNFSPEGLSNPGEWGGIISDFLSLYPEFNIEISSDYNPNKLDISADVEIQAEVASVRNLNLGVYLTESHIINWQEDDAAEESPVPDYEHNHVLRASMNGSFGESVNTSNNEITPGDMFSKSYTIPRGDDWVPENMYVLAFVYDTDTYEVLQAEEIRLIEE
ncbi:MAG: Omp28-related outer membrane protein [Bacteroidota bacterium]